MARDSLGKRALLGRSMGVNSHGSSPRGCYCSGTHAPESPRIVTPRTLTMLRLQWAGFFALIVGLGLLFVAAIVWLSGCTPAEELKIANVAGDVKPILQEGCVFIEEAVPNPWISFLCTSAEAVDALLMKMPGARAESKAVVVQTDGGKYQAVVVRITLNLPASDAGAE